LSLPFNALKACVPLSPALEIVTGKSSPLPLELDSSVTLSDDSSSRLHWCAVLGCTEEDLMQAIRAVGPNPCRIRVYLVSAWGAAQTSPVSP